MKARILDVDALRAISPAALAAYARGEGWQKSDSYGIYSDVYSADRRPEIILPRTDRLGDYATIVSKLISIFAKTADRDELVTYRDLIGADRDVIRVRSLGDSNDGSVLIDAGVKIVSQARDMLLAAACAARSPQALFRAGANREAMDYMRSVRLGQTEHGSFVVTLLAPVPPQLQLPFDPAWLDFDQEPYERQVTRRLTQALDASRNAVERTMPGEGAEAFEKAVSAGVSANLCEAVAALVEQSNGLEINVTWAKTRPTPEIHHAIGFSLADAEILKEAGRTFRDRHPKPDVSLFGTVHQLKRDHEEVDGLVALKVLMDGRLQSVRAVLDQANYSIAIQAHDQKAPVAVKGDLERVGQRWQLTNASVTGFGADDGSDGEPLP
jgi:hypothetical protein